MGFELEDDKPITLKDYLKSFGKVEIREDDYLFYSEPKLKQVGGVITKKNGKLRMF